MESGIEQRVEGLAVLCIHGVGALDLVDVDALEERLVGDAAQRIIEAHVDRVSIAGQGQAVFQVGFGLVVLDFPRLDARVEEREPPGEAVLFLFEQVERHGSGVVGVQKAAAFVSELVAFGRQRPSLRLTRGAQVIELASEHVPERGDDVFGDLHLPVVVLNLLLDVGYGHRLPDAVGAFGVPPGADEVRVDVAVPVLGMGNHEPGAAVAAVDRAFQVVVVGLRLLPGDLVSGEYVLHPVPPLGADERLVQTVVGGATEDHVAFVVRVRQHPLDRGESGRLRGALRSRHGRQPAVDQLLPQGDGRVVPTRVCLERPLDERGAVRVWLNGGHVATQLVASVDVEVAEGCAGNRATGGRLLRHAFGDLTGEVARVELCDRGHDAVQ
nr:hypothetical protein [Microbacterium sp.]